jgi:hypothetical protein
MTNFTFDIINEYDNSGIIESALRDCIVPATSAVRHLTKINYDTATEEQKCTDDASVIEQWKAVSLAIIELPEGRFIKSFADDELLGYGFGKVLNVDVFHAIGGFYGNINGSRKYAFQADWWVALAEHIKAMGFKQLWFSVRDGSTLERCCEIIADKVSYTCVFEEDNSEGSEEYNLFKMTL